MGEDFKENFVLAYMFMHISCCCFMCNFVIVGSRMAHFYAIIDNKDSVFYILISHAECDTYEIKKIKNGDAEVVVIDGGSGGDW